MAFINICGDMYVFELAIARSILFVCSAAFVFTLFKDKYFELLKDEEQVL